MSQFFFHVRDRTGLLLDEEGRDLVDVAAATAIALNEARSLIGHDAFGGVIDLHQSIEVEDAAGALVHTLNFVDAVEIVERAPPPATNGHAPALGSPRRG